MPCNKGYFKKLKAELKHYDLAEVSEISGVPFKTIYGWTYGKRDQHSLHFCNFIAVAEAIGFDVNIKLTRRKS